MSGGGSKGGKKGQGGFKGSGKGAGKASGGFWGKSGGGKGGMSQYGSWKGQGKGAGVQWNPWYGKGGKVGGGGMGMGGGAGGKAGMFKPGVFCNWCKEEGHLQRECAKLTKRNQERDRMRGQANVLDEEDLEEEECLITEVCEGNGVEDEPEVVCEVCEEADGWVKELLMMDSGAAASFLRKGAPDHIPIHPVPEAEKKRKWVNASGGGITQKGISPVKFMTDSWRPKRMQLRRSDQVSKNIGSVGEITDTGTICLFTNQGGAIVPDPDGALGRWILNSNPNSTHFDRTGNVYNLPMWIPKDPPQVPREGRKNKEGGEKRTNQQSKGRAAPERSEETAKEATSSEWQQRDKKGRAKPVTLDDDMNVDIVLTRSEFDELVCMAGEKGYKSKSLVFSRLGR